MRKELFKHEINIIRDTFGRLLRRNAQTNLIKLTKKTHPADHKKDVKSCKGN